MSFGMLPFVALLMQVLPSATQPAPSVCKAIKEASLTKGRELQVTGWVIADMHFGFFMSEKPEPSMCAGIWLFSKPALVALRIDPEANSVSQSFIAGLHGRYRRYVTVQGHLETRTSLTFPWANRAGPSVFSPEAVSIHATRITFHGP